MLNLNGKQIEPLNPEVKAIYEYISSKFRYFNYSKINTSKS